MPYQPHSCQSVVKMEKTKKVKGEKYSAIEKAMFLLKQVGYTIEDSCYRSLVKERAELERK